MICGSCSWKLKLGWRILETSSTRHAKSIYFGDKKTSTRSSSSSSEATESKASLWSSREILTGKETNIDCLFTFFLKTWRKSFALTLRNFVRVRPQKSHSILRAKRATFTFWVDKSWLKIPKMVHFGEFLKTWSLWPNSLTRQVSFL